MSHLRPHNDSFYINVTATKERNDFYMPPDSSDEASAPSSDVKDIMDMLVQNPKAKMNTEVKEGKHGSKSDTEPLPKSETKDYMAQLSSARESFEMAIPQAKKQDIGDMPLVGRNVVREQALKEMLDKWGGKLPDLPRRSEVPKAPVQEQESQPREFAEDQDPTRIITPKFLEQEKTQAQSETVEKLMGENEIERIKRSLSDMNFTDSLDRERIDVMTHAIDQVAKSVQEGNLIKAENFLKSITREQGLRKKVEDATGFRKLKLDIARGQMEEIYQGIKEKPAA